MKAQAHTSSGDMDTGIDLALQGIKLARSYDSQRPINQAQEMYDQLIIIALGKHARTKDLKEALHHASRRAKM